MTPLTLEQVIFLEEQVWKALRSGDARLDAQMLADDFLGVYPTGFSTKQAHCDQLKNGPTVASYSLEEPRITVLGDDQVLLSYLANWSRVKGGKAAPMERMYISSIWRRMGSEWKNTFSQDTPVPG